AKTGLRIGEALGLRTDDVDVEQRVVQVARTYHGHGRFGPPKSGKPRSVDLSLEAVDILRERMTQANGRGWLFRTRGHPFHASYAANRCEVLCAEAGIAGVTLHSLRHASASALIAAGESVAYVQQQLGHASIQTTVDVYGSHYRLRNLRAVDRLDRL